MAALAGAVLLLAGAGVWLSGPATRFGERPRTASASPTHRRRRLRRPTRPAIRRRAHRPIASDYDLTGGCRFVHFGADGPLVVLGFEDGADQHFARVYDLTTGRAVTPPHDAPLQAPCFSPDGRWVVTVDLNADVWSAATGGSLSPPAKPDDALNHLNGSGDLPDYLAFATFSPDGKRTLTGYGLPGGLGALGLGGGAGLAAASAPSGGAPGAPGAPKGKKPQGKAFVCNAATGKPLTPPLKHDGAVVQGMFSPDGRRASRHCQRRRHGAGVGRRCRKPVSPPLQHADAVSWAAFQLPDGRCVVTASADNERGCGTRSAASRSAPPLTTTTWSTMRRSARTGRRW